jgi:vancomycin resistance protein YoaR
LAVIAKRAGSYQATGFPKYVLAPLLALAALGLIALGVNAAFADRALPRVSVAGLDVGGASAAEIRARLDAEAARPWASSRVAVELADGETFATTNGALAIAPNLDRAVADALAYGHAGTVGERAVAWANALSGQAAVPMAMRSTGGDLDAWVRSIATAVDRAPADGVIAVTYRGVEVTAAVIGRTTDRASLRDLLLAPQTLGDRTVGAPVRLSYPAVDASGLRDAAKAKAVTTALELRAGDRVVSEDAAGLATLLVVEKVVAAPGELDAIPAGATAPSVRYAYHARLDEARVAAWVAGAAKILDHPAKSASYAVRPDGSLTVVSAEDGVKIDRAQLIADALGDLVRSTRAPRLLGAAFVKDTPVFTTEQATQLVGKMTQVATFTTTYPPSAQRHANITTGALQFNDVVIGPGDTFSFWDRLGPVTVERGYAYAGAIIDNRSDENVIGGGLCQVSTTLFNAVARAGYDVLERHEHGYYIDRYPLGFDAAVFEPGVDFRWKNDTQYPVLIKAYPAATALRFDLISVPSGRRVVIGDPVQWALTSPARNQPADPAYPPGAVVQGRDVSRSWTVWEGDKVVHEQTFSSHYVPVWGGPAR